MILCSALAAAERQPVRRLWQRGWHAFFRVHRARFVNARCGGFRRAECSLCWRGTTARGAGSALCRCDSKARGAGVVRPLVVQEARRAGVVRPPVVREARCASVVRPPVMLNARYVVRDRVLV